MLKQSARLDVKSTSIVTSFSDRKSRKSIPIGAFSASSMMPFDSTSIPSSEKEHSMPCDGWPRSLAFLILKSPGSVAPTVATATFRP
ncbi:Uncharacterised protein [Vibrio cholerae]|nr:Uncharacterised protein [Vibrio cholerae]